MLTQFIKEFQKFISRGNVMDLAIAVVMGSAFTGIVNSLVNDVFTPILGMIMGGVNIGHLSITLGQASILYGKFLQAVINFFLISLVVFILIKSMNILQKKLTGRGLEQKKPADIVLLTEIRDLLKKGD